MRPDELLVGGLAITFSLVAVAIAVGPWERPYQLRNVARIRDRFGMPAARCIWLLVGLATLVTGGLILSGVRPGYAVPEESISDTPESASLSPPGK